MKKIPTLYIRNPETNLKHVMPTVHPDCQWVIDGEGFASYKHDGTSVRIERDGYNVLMWKRREVKPDKPVPDRFVQEGEPDPTTGKVVGWVPCDREDPADRWHIEAVDNIDSDFLEDGTYELVGPKVQGNPHGYDSHILVRHGIGYVGDVPTGFVELGVWLHDWLKIDSGFEGIVWHSPDGRMAKIKARDFPVPVEE